MSRLLITGSRYFTRASLMEKALEFAVHGLGWDLTIVQGEALGADTLARRTALLMGLKVESHPADWTIGKHAGHVRNSKMVSAGADLCMAFYVQNIESRGTDNCVVKAEAAGITVIKYTQKMVYRVRVKKRK